MNDQNINPEPVKKNDSCQAPKNNKLNKTGLDQWNDRLDNNLESEGEANMQADENAEDFKDSADGKATNA
ncbi:hypothetical protein [Pedobacter sp. JCM 36344]|uniref:hypothetical protein n=1 Tax=Pedobacter sp. JCM 36344 TaxID=3374280 RepID=UPI0039782D5C